jgi:hypothetical protein
MTSDLDILPDHRIVDELSLDWVSPGLQNLLKHVISIYIMS